MDWKDARELLVSDPEVQKELENNEARYKVIEELIRIRKENNLTQSSLAAAIHTSQSNISRLESGNYNPSLEFLEKIAKATHRKLEIRFT